MYASGTGVQKDPARSRALLERAARNGYAPAQAKLREMGITLNENGDVIEPATPAPTAAATENKDDAWKGGGKATNATSAPMALRGAAGAPAVPLAQPAAGPQMTPADPIQPDVIAKMQQADLTTVYAGIAAYTSGDRKTALSIWHAAATRNVAEAQLRVGLMFERGDGAPQDVIEAYRWLRHAAAQGHAQAINELARVSSRLAPAERAIAESLVREPVTKAKKPN
jgi:TPR repeat protein